jgi:lipopolysaccharide/colanic/teichoic acid biosynthesis glycosyltransferase
MRAKYPLKNVKLFTSRSLKCLKTPTFLKQKNMTFNNHNFNFPQYLTIKRCFDILFSLLALILLSPFLCLVAIAIKIENPGPVFYKSKRVGRFYQTFDFYKFRSMYVNADAMLSTVKDQNQYGKTVDAINFQEVNEESMFLDDCLIGDDGLVSEEDWNKATTAAEANAFIKIKDDPRITKVGQFIRNTSIDELPQLLNILKGDMSFVGNRPLPVYEATKLTTDEYIDRFNAPAGLTGLWQVTDRGRADVSPENRKLLDVQYATQGSFLMDLTILFKTPMAAFQQENV